MTSVYGLNLGVWDRFQLLAIAQGSNEQSHCMKGEEILSSWVAMKERSTLCVITAVIVTVHINITCMCSLTIVKSVQSTQLTLSLFSNELSRFLNMMWYSEIFWPINVLRLLVTDPSSLYLVTAISLLISPLCFYKQCNLQKL